MPRAAPNKRKLTAILLQRLKPQPRAFMVWDTLQRGLALRIEPSGYKAFKVVYRHHGRPRWYHLGAVDAVALADARKLAATVMLEVIRGKDPAAEKRAERGAGTFGSSPAATLRSTPRRKTKAGNRRTISCAGIYCPGGAS
jgi:hypothetical protein